MLEEQTESNKAVAKSTSTITNLYDYLNLKLDEQKGGVAIGTCNCKPTATALASVEQPEKELKIACANGATHWFKDVRVDPVLRGHKQKTKSQLRALISSWVTYRENLPVNESFDVEEREVGVDESQPEVVDEVDADAVLSAGFGAMGLADGKPRSRQIVLGAQVMKPDAAQHQVQQVHAKLHVIKDFLLQNAGNIAFDVAAFAMAYRSGNLHSLNTQVDKAIQKHLPTMVHGFANALAMEFFADRLGSERMQGTVYRAVERYKCQLPAESVSRPLVFVPAPNNETQEQAERAEQMRQTRSSSKKRS